MRKLFIGLFIGLLLGAAGAWFKLQPARQKTTQGDGDEKKEAAAVSVSRTADDVVQVRLNAETRNLIGLVTATIAGTNMSPEVEAVGRVLDPTPLHQQITDVHTTLAALDASRKEHDRLKSLFNQNQNASARALETATAVLQRDDALAEAARVRLTMAWGRSIVDRSDLETLVASLTAQQSLLIRLDPPVGVSFARKPEAAHVAGLAGDALRFPVEVLGPAPSADPLAQGQGFFALLRTNAFAPGAIVLGWLTTADNEIGGFIIPRPAVVRHAGDTFVYVESASDTFERRPVALTRPLSDGFFVRDGLKEHERVVVIGAQLLLSEELKGQVGEE